MVEHGADCLANRLRGDRDELMKRLTMVEPDGLSRERV